MQHGRARSEGSLARSTTSALESKENRFDVKGLDPPLTLGKLGMSSMKTVALHEHRLEKAGGAG